MMTALLGCWIEEKDSKSKELCFVYFYVLKLCPITILYLSQKVDLKQKG